MNNLDLHDRPRFGGEFIMILLWFASMVAAAFVVSYFGTVGLLVYFILLLTLIV